MARLAWGVREDADPESYDLPQEGETKIGRRPDNDVVIADPRVSGNHCRIYFEDGGYFVEDVGSSNGTMVDFAPIHEPTRLDGRANIGIGHTLVEFMDD